MSWRVSKDMRIAAHQANEIARNANDVASQAVSAQEQANQIALYSFCGLKLVSLPNRLHKCYC